MSLALECRSPDAKSCLESRFLHFVGRQSQLERSADPVLLDLGFVESLRLGRHSLDAGYWLEESHALHPAEELPQQERLHGPDFLDPNPFLILRWVRAPLQSSISDPLMRLRDPT